MNYLSLSDLLLNQQELELCPKLFARSDKMEYLLHQLHQVFES